MIESGGGVEWGVEIFKKLVSPALAGEETS